MKRIYYTIFILVTFFYVCDKPNKGTTWHVDWGQNPEILAASAHSMNNGDTATVAISLDLDVVQSSDVRVEWDSSKFTWLSDSIVAVTPEDFDLTIHKTDSATYTMLAQTKKQKDVIASIDQNILITKLEAKAAGVTNIVLVRATCYAYYDPDTKVLTAKTASITNDTCVVTIS